MSFDLPVIAEWLGRASLQASVVVVLVLVINTIFRATLPRRWSYLLWMIVVARLVLPIGPAAPFSVYNLGNFMAVESAPPAAVAKPQGVWLPESVALAMPGFVAAEPPAPATSPEPAPLPWFELAAVVWLAGVVLLVAGRVRAALRFRAKLRHARPVDDARVLRTLALSSRTMGVRRSVPLLESDAVSSPALVGLRNPRLVLPAGLAEGLRRSELKLIFQHELVHLKRKDLVANALLFVLRTMHWFNPLIWIAVARCRTDQELACDEAVLSVVRPSQRARYGLTILKVIERMAAPRALPGSVALLQGKQEIERRIDMITRYRTKSKVASVLGFALFLGLGCVALSSAMPTEAAAVCPPGEEKEVEVTVRKMTGGDGSRVIVIKSGDDVHTIDLSDLGEGVNVIELDEGEKGHTRNQIVRLHKHESGDTPHTIQRFNTETGEGAAVLKRRNVPKGDGPHGINVFEMDDDVKKIVKRLNVDSEDHDVFEWIEKGDGDGRFVFEIMKDDGNNKARNVQRFHMAEGEAGDGHGFVFKSDGNNNFVFGKKADAKSDGGKQVYSWSSDDGHKIEVRVEAIVGGDDAPKRKVIRRFIGPKSGNVKKQDHDPFDVDVDVQVFGIDGDGEPKQIWRSRGKNSDHGDADPKVFLWQGKDGAKGNAFFSGGKSDSKGNFFFSPDGEFDFAKGFSTGDGKVEFFFGGDGEFDVEKFMDGKGDMFKKLKSASGKDNVFLYGFGEGEGGAKSLFMPKIETDGKGRFEVILDADGNSSFGTWIDATDCEGKGDAKKSPFGNFFFMPKGDKNGEDVQAHGYTIRLEGEGGEPIERYLSGKTMPKGQKAATAWLERLEDGDGAKVLRYRVDGEGNIQKIEAAPKKKAKAVKKDGREVRIL